MALQTQIPKKTFRQQIRFWLDRFREDENELADYVDELKQNRSFASTMRDALKLIKELRNGQVDTLLQLFPWIEDHFKNQHHPTDTQPAEITYQLKELKQLLLHPGKMTPNESHDEDDFEVGQSKVGEEYNYMPNWNAPISLAAAGNDFSSLEPNMIWYGIRIGKISPDQIKPELITAGLAAGKLPPEMENYAPKQKPNSIKKLDGANIELTPPSFDGIEF